MRKNGMVLLALMLALTGMFTAVQAAEFPETDIQGIIPWGAGGETDRFSRALVPHVEPLLGKQLIMNNKPGGTGAIGMQYVFSRPSDGYTLLFAAENPQIYGVLDLMKMDYGDFYPIQIISRGVPVIATTVDKPWKTLKEMVDEIKANPGKIKMGNAGIGSLPHVVESMLKVELGIQPIDVPFDGTGPGITALLGGHIDVFPATIAGVSEHVRAGRLKILTVVADTPMPGYENLPLIVSEYPQFKKYLPWGPFYGVFCKKDVPDAIKKKLAEAFEKGANQPGFKEFVSNGGAIQMNIHGEEADKFLNRWKSVTSWLMQDAGAAKVNPETLKIPRP